MTRYDAANTSAARERRGGIIAHTVAALTLRYRTISSSRGQSIARLFAPSRPRIPRPKPLKDGALERSPGDAALAGRWAGQLETAAPTSPVKPERPPEALLYYRLRPRSFRSAYALPFLSAGSVLADVLRLAEARLA